MINMDDSNSKKASTDNLTDNLEEILSYIDATDRMTWLRVGAALKTEYKENGFEIWNKWSQKANNYDAKVIKNQWESLSMGRVKKGTIYYLAKQSGFNKKEGLAPNKAKEEGKILTQNKTKEEKDPIEKVKYLWKTARDVTSHAYLERKQIDIQIAQKILRQKKIDQKEFLLVPLLDSSGELRSLQFIAEDGTKKFSANLPIKSCFSLIGNREEAKRHVYIAEGFATGASIHKVTGQPVIIAFNANNLIDVARELEKNHFSDKYTIAADNDSNRAGIDKALIAQSQLSNAQVVMPGFDDDDKKSFAEKFNGVATDFNDLYLLRGNEVTRKQVTENTVLSEDEKMKDDRKIEEVKEKDIEKVVLPESSNNEKSHIDDIATKQVPVSKLDEDKEVEEEVKEEENYIEKVENLVVPQVVKNEMRSERNGSELVAKQNTTPEAKETTEATEAAEAAEAADKVNKEKPHTYDLPEHIRKQYYVEDGNFYDKAGNIKFRDKGPKVVTRGVDYKVIEHMLDVAQAKGWTSIKINGSKEFKKAMYVAALERGLEIDSWQERVKELIGKNDGIKAGAQIVNEKKSSIPAAADSTVTKEATNETEKPVEKIVDKDQATSVEKDRNVKEKYRSIFERLSRKHKEIFSFLENECIKAAKSLDLEKSKKIMNNFYNKAYQIVSEKKVDDFLTQAAKQEDRTLSHAVTQERVVEKNLGPGIEI